MQMDNSFFKSPPHLSQVPLQELWQALSVKRVVLNFKLLVLVPSIKLSKQLLLLVATWLPLVLIWFVSPLSWMYKLMGRNVLQFVSLLNPAAAK